MFVESGGFVVVVVSEGALSPALDISSVVLCLCAVTVSRGLQTHERRWKWQLGGRWGGGECCEWQPNL